MTWKFDLATDIGGRAEQQDRLEVLTIPDRQGEYLVVLADGMGGQQQGALAAQTVIDTAREVLVKVLEENRRIINEYLIGEFRGKASFTHIIAWAMVRARSFGAERSPRRRLS